MTTYTPTIGLEIHAELNTNAKMFCGCANDPHHEEPNIHVCPVCMAHPGTLPTVNEAAVQKLLTFGHAIGASLADYTEFDRKNYFYPDIPKAYQISQYEFPFVYGGMINEVTLTRVHLEEDTARSQHDTGHGSLVNFNRAGVPLLELVTEPVIKDAATAGACARELQLILRTLGISHAHMERGEMRVEANVSVSENETFGTKVEVKNLNSFRSVESAIAYEIERQINLREAGEEVTAETRGWDENRQRTFGQRSKETAKDYRYFPDPDIPKIKVGSYEPFSSSRINEKLPALPQEKREKYEYLGLTSTQVETLLHDTYLDAMFAKLLQSSPDDLALLRLAVNYLTSDTVAICNERGAYPAEYHSHAFHTLLTMFQNEALNSRATKDLLPEVLFDGIDPETVADERGLVQSNSAESLQPIVDEVIRENPAVVEEFKGGKDASIQFLVGQGMKKTRGAANPKVLRELLEQSM
jgi:aspartyl-tRNA(Asn)/glutamyl-tRNA(Gln) amidotransferase subunit B